MLFYIYDKSAKNPLSFCKFFLSAEKGVRRPPRFPASRAPAASNIRRAACSGPGAFRAARQLFPGFTAHCRVPAGTRTSRTAGYNACRRWCRGKAPQQLPQNGAQRAACHSSSAAPRQNSRAFSHRAARPSSSMAKHRATSASKRVSSSLAPHSARIRSACSYCAYETRHTPGTTTCMVTMRAF